MITKILDEKNIKFNVSQRQKSTFNAAVENVKIANDATKSSQNWLWSLGMAELSFLSILIFNEELKLKDYEIYLIKILIFIILTSFVFFIIGSFSQSNHIRKIARIYESLSNKASNTYLKKGIIELDSEPDDLKLPENQITSSKFANYMIIISYWLIILTTIKIMIFIFFYKNH